MNAAANPQQGTPASSAPRRRVILCDAIPRGVVLIFSQPLALVVRDGLGALYVDPRSAVMLRLAMGAP